MITGAAQGIGAAISARLSQDGAAVAVIDINAAKAEEIASALRTTGARAVSAVIDVTDRASVAEGVAGIAAELGPPAVLVNNAGIYKSMPLLDTSPDAWNLSLDVMLKGALLMSQEAAPHMIRAGWGRIINLGSMMGNVGLWRGPCLLHGEVGHSGVDPLAGGGVGKTQYLCEYHLPGQCNDPDA